MFKERANDSGVDNAIRYAKLIGTKTMSARVYCARELQSDVASTELLLKVRVSEHSGSFGKYHRLGSIIVILDRFDERVGFAAFIDSKNTRLSRTRRKFTFDIAEVTRIYHW